MDKKTSLVLFIGIVFLSNLVSAEPLLSLNYAICKNDSVLINNINYVNGTNKIYESADNEYNLKINDKYNRTIITLNIPVSFLIFSEPPIEVNCSLGYQRLPWEPDSKYLIFYHTNSPLQSIDLTEYFCNKNKKCEPQLGETPANCQQDCPPVSKETGARKIEYTYPLLILFLIIILGCFIIAFYFKRKNEEQINRLKAILDS